MRLNSLKPEPGSRRRAKRVGRGPASTLGKTAGRGQKGQHSRSGGYNKVGFEGGQLPLQRRVPKRGFRSRTQRDYAEIRLHELGKVDGDVADLAALKAAGVVRRDVERAKVIGSGELSRAVTVRGLQVSKGARAAIEGAGGKVEA